MNTISRILLGFIVVAVLVTLWVVLTQKNNGSTGTCGGNCSGCGANCTQRKEDQKK